MITVRTGRLLLRPAAATDLLQIHAFLSNAQATAFWSTLPHQTLAETQAWLDDMMATAPPLGEDFVVEYRGQIIGKAGLFRFPEIGFIFNPAFWGLGLASEAVAAVVDRAFDLHGLAAITADVDPRNTASLSLLKRLGFVETGRAEKTWLIGDQWCDSLYLQLTGPQRRSLRARV